MDKSYPNKTSMVVHALEIGKDPFRPRDIGEKMLRPEIPYLSVIGALMYLANCTRPNIAFAVNLLARHSADPTRRHWTGAKCILRYLNGTKDHGLFFKKNHDPSMIVSGIDIRDTPSKEVSTHADFLGWLETY